MDEKEDAALHFSNENENPSENPDIAYQESVYLSFVDQKKGVGGVWRIGLEPNQKRANCAATLWRENGESYTYFYRHHPLPGGNLEDLTVGPLHYQLKEPMKKLHVELSDKDLKVDFNWTAGTPVFDFAKDQPESLTGWTSQHYQQFGHFEANVNWGADSFTLDGMTFRNHSWGVRDWERGWDWMITGGAFLPNESIINVWKYCRDEKASDGGIVLTHMDPEKDTRVPFTLSEYQPVLDPPPIVTALSYKLDMPGKVQSLWGRAIAPTLVMPFGKAHFTTALFKWDVDGEPAYGIVDNVAGKKFAHESLGGSPRK